MSTATLSLEALLAAIQPDAQAVADGRRRMTDIWHGRPTDSLPLCFGASAPEGVAWNPDMRTHVADPDQMLYDAAIGLACTARAGSDAQLAMRVNSGTGTLATLAGCTLLPSEHALPWTTHITRAQIDAFDPGADLATLGIMPQVQAWYARFRAQLPACVGFFCADTQGPFALAHLLYGDDIFYDITDDPGFVHALLEKTTALYIGATRLMKTWIGEPADRGLHFSFALANGGVRACEDTATLLSPADIDTFVLPYQARALEAFGGGFIHYCGNHAALLQGYMDNPWVRGLNFGNPERHDFGVILPALIARGKCYAGTINRLDDESLDAYFRRVVGYTQGSQRGLILTPELRGDEVAEPARVLDTWRAAQA
jgi:uroporphyrinogen-III decarboxylase